jgi:hypothetical protein
VVKQVLRVTCWGSSKTPLRHPLNNFLFRSHSVKLAWTLLCSITLRLVQATSAKSPGTDEPLPLQGPECEAKVRGDGPSPAPGSRSSGRPFANHGVSGGQKAACFRRTSCGALPPPARPSHRQRDPAAACRALGGGGHAAVYPPRRAKLWTPKYAGRGVLFWGVLSDASRRQRPQEGNSPQTGRKRGHPMGNTS